MEKHITHFCQQLFISTYLVFLRNEHRLAFGYCNTIAKIPLAISFLLDVIDKQARILMLIAQTKYVHLLAKYINNNLFRLI